MSTPIDNKKENGVKSDSMDEEEELQLPIKKKFKRINPLDDEIPTPPLPTTTVNNNGTSSTSAVAESAAMKIDSVPTVKKESSSTTTTTTTTTTSSTNGSAKSTPKKIITKKEVKKDESSSSDDSSDSDSSESDSSDYSSSDSDSSEDDKKKKKITPAPKKPAPASKKPSTTTTTTTTTTTSTPKKPAATPTKKSAPVKKPVKKEESSSDDDSDDSSDSDSSSYDSDDSSDSDSDSSSSEESSSEDDKKKKKPASTPTKKSTTTTTKAKKETTTTTKKATTATTAKAKSSTTTTTTTKTKTETKGKKRKAAGDDGEEGDDEEYRWWEEEESTDGSKWQTLSHNGPIFPPAYEPHGVKLYYEGKPVQLTNAQEELATFYAQYLETDHVKKEIFRKNFFTEFKQLLSAEQKKVIKKMEGLDFSHINRYLTQKKEERKARTKAEKEAELAKKKEVEKIHGYALVDGHKQKIANYLVEPPGLFLGRGAHPKTGMLKRRIYPSDVTINIGENEKVPPSPIPGHNWKEVIHNNKVSWLAFWRESVNGGFKYVWLAPSSKIKGIADRKKFETARKLKKHIDKIRAEYKKSIASEDREEKELGCALYLIDFLALRVGNEKEEDTADTVGCCSLRMEHITFAANNTITLDFLGKDSMRYFNTVEIDEKAYKALVHLSKTGSGKKKKPDDLLFDTLKVGTLNNHLKKQMPGLSAKVFRTYNASITLQKELDKMSDDYTTVEEKILFFNRCNREVAILCNHQKAPPKNIGEVLGKIDEKIAELEDLKTLCKHQLKSRPKDEMEDLKKRESERLKRLIQTNIEKNTDESKKDKEISEDTRASFERSRKIPDDKDKIKAKIEKIESQIKKLDIQKTNKDELKTVALGTSKINYLDPRITVAWCKKQDVPVEKIFSKSLRDKFPWSDVDADYVF
eukprot:gene3590-4472_t